MKKQIVFLTLFLMLAAPCRAQRGPAVLEPEGDGISNDELWMLSLAEAVKRLSVMSADISGINLGDNISNDIAWRKKWVEQLKETEETFHKIINSAPPPFTLYYSTVIETKNIDYQKETADLNISLNLLANAEWFAALQRSLKAAIAVQRGLDATGRKKDWGLDEWPWQGVSKTNPFAKTIYIGDDKSKQNDISVEFQIVNQQGWGIGWQEAKLNPSFRIERDFIINFETSKSSILTFNAVKASDISDNLSIRIASVNGKSPETARFPIIAVKTKEFPKYQVQTRKITFTDPRDGKKYEAVEIGLQTWMAENLSFNAKGSVCYGNKPANCQKYGKLYNWETAMKACPSGWHLPSDREWGMLVDFVGGEDVAGTKLKAKDGRAGGGNGTDEFGFSALPGGSGGSGGSFGGVGDGGVWWSATEINASRAWNRIMLSSGATVHKDDSNKSGYLSVRCVQD